MIIRLAAALFYDAIIVCSLWLVVTAVAVFFHGGLAIPPASRGYQGVLVATMAMYFIASFRYGGQTIGFKSWRLRLIRESRLKLRLITVA